MLDAVADFHAAFYNITPSNIICYTNTNNAIKYS